MRITVDTNILVSVSFWLGTPKEIIKLVEDRRVELVLSSFILDEFERVMGLDRFHPKLQGTKSTTQEIIRKLVSISEIVVTTGEVKIVKADPDDDKVVECGVKGNVDYIISGDKHLLELGEYQE
jgi:uncharacterized protein